MRALEKESVKSVFKTEEINNPVRLSRLALILDSAGEGILALITNPDIGIVRLEEGNLSLQDVLSDTSKKTELKTITLCGSPASIIKIGSSGTNGFALGQLNSAYIANLAARYDAEPSLVQSIRDVATYPELLRLVSKRRIGWIFDKICEQACLDLRQRFNQKTRLEVIIFGNSGAILGKATLEPGLFQL